MEQTPFIGQQTWPYKNYKEKEKKKFVSIALQGVKILCSTLELASSVYHSTPPCQSPSGIEGDIKTDEQARTCTRAHTYMLIRLVERNYLSQAKHAKSRYQ